MTDAKRQAPADGEYYDWKRFEQWADDEGVGIATADWMPWWLCWRKAYAVALSD
jgi:hypothetical protein